jgi:glycosyltransferase involved in cell wall biosynthesis
MHRTDTPLRIAVMSKPLDNWTSGSGHHLDELMRHILDLNDGSIDFTFVHYQKSENPLYSRVREIIIPRDPFRASAIVAKEKFDIVHYAPLSVFAPVWGVKAKKTATVHGIEEVLYPEGYTLVQRLHETILQPAYMRRMDGIATVSNASRNYFIEHYRIKPERIVITTNGLGKAYRRLSADELAMIPLGIPDKPFVLHISRYSMRKNPVTLIGGFARFVERTGIDCNLVCAGKGWDGEEAKALAEKAGIADRYVAPGFISEEQAVALLNRASAFAFPSFAEGFGMPNIEAMACGCPVVTSNIFAIPEIVGDAAYVMDKVDDPDDLARGLEKIFSDVEFREALIERGYARLPRFDWNASARAMLDFWKKL